MPRPSGSVAAGGGGWRSPPAGRDAPEGIADRRRVRLRRGHWLPPLVPPPARPHAHDWRAAAAANDGVLGLSALKPELTKKRVEVSMKTSAPVKRDNTAANLAALEEQAKAMFPKE